MRRGFEYAPSRESPRIVTLEPDVRPVHRRRVRRAGAGECFTRRSTRRPRSRWPRSRGRRRRTSTPRSAPPARRTRSAGRRRARRRARQVPVPHRAHPAGARRASSPCSRRSTAASRSRSRATSTCRSPPRTSSTTPAGPTSSSTRSPRERPRPLGVAAQVIPWNFPLLMAAWKLAPALAAGNTVVLKPAETTPLTALLFADDAARGRAAAGRRQHRHRRRATPAPRWSRHPGVDKVAFTGSTEVGKAIQRELAGSGKGLTLELGGKAANIVFDDAAARPGRRGHRQRHLLQPGPRVLRGLAAARAGVGRRARRRQAGAPPGRRCASATRSTRTPTSARSTPRRSSTRIAELVAGRRATRAPTICQPSCALPDRGYCFPPTVFTDVAQSHRIAQEEIFGPVLSRADVPHARRGRGEGQQHAVRPLCRRLDREGLAHPLDGAAAAGRRGVGQHVQPLRPRAPVRRLQGVGLRPRGRAARPRPLPAAGDER